MVQPTLLQPARLCLLLLLASIAPIASAQVIVGGGGADGSLEVRKASDPDALLLEVDSTGQVVRVGTSGSNAVDTDFEVADHNNGAPALWVDASSAILHVGAELNSDDGDLLVWDGSGEVTIALNGEAGSIALGSVGDDGDLAIRDTTNTDVFTIDGDTGNASQVLGAEGLIKAWCRVAADGSFIDGYRCTDGIVDSVPYPFRPALGTYEVDFTALGTDITARPFVASCSAPTSDTCNEIRAFFKSGDSSVIQVFTEAGTDHPFTIVVF